MRRRSVIYAVVHDDVRVTFGHSPRPEVDRRYWLDAGARHVIPFGPSLPPVWAEFACRGLASMPQGGGRSPSAGFHKPFTALQRWLARRLGLLESMAPWEKTVHEAAARARALLRAAGYDWMGKAKLQASSAGVGWAEVSVGNVRDFPTDEPAPGPPPQAVLDAVASLLTGRLLTTAEVARQVERAGIALDRPLEECLTWLVLNGRVERLPGVCPTAHGGFRCSRCGESDEVRAWDCASCGEPRCYRCEACRELGAVSGCVFLYAAKLEVALGTDQATSPASTGRPRRAVTVRLPALTDAQRRAAWALDEFVRRPVKREALVWAVCGAGKTEVTFLAASHVLARGGRVLFAVPRRDVVQELGPRLSAAFPSTEIRVLHGGPDRTDYPGLPPGSLTIATTHQLLRFYRAFDLVVLDEVDAYPYRGSAMLHRAMERAVRGDGLVIRMSATPDEAMVQEARTGRSLLVPIPARHHGHPLPVPELLVDRSLEPGSSGPGRPYRPSELVLYLVHRTLADSPPARLLVFVPTIALAERVGRGMAAALAELVGGSNVAWSHSRDPERERKRRAFHAGDLKVLVATTILERGITVPDVDVLVLFSDVEHIFQTPTLIQMAGRVGRTAARPAGRVAFVGRRITRSMRQAVAHIQHMNELAKQMGLLKIS
ncbi:MAG: hypothetical protein BAA04_09095 [Firmicutes bacterium ZCTH02-B6]|nr:MAG: hypothetical protein BAA04_09095 [Firmicutes bacterium ZCTH02-B6]